MGVIGVYEKAYTLHTPLLHPYHTHSLKYVPEIVLEGCTHSSQHPPFITCRKGVMDLYDFKGSELITSKKPLSTRGTGKDIVTSIDRYRGKAACAPNRGANYEMSREKKKVACISKLEFVSNVCFKRWILYFV